MISIQLRDHKLGGSLIIEFDLDADLVVINGVEVERKPEPESGDGTVHFAPNGPIPWKVHHTLTEENLAAMRDLWRARKT